jgi:uncharacterized membrane protein
MQEYKHDHPPIQNINKIFTDQSTFGQKTADKVTNTIGSWMFIIIQSVLLFVWIIFNIMLAAHQVQLHGFVVSSWDPYPFILLNLVLSFQAAYTGPIVMMSQNRQTQKDRLTAEHDYQINLKAEQEIKFLMEHLDEQDKLILAIQNQLKEKA